MPNRKKKVTAAREDRQELPIWNATTGNLSWRGSIVIHLAAQAHAERAVLDRLQSKKWRFVVKNPLPRDGVGDPTSTRRSAICNLMRHQGEPPQIQFFSALGGFVAWCPAEWLRE